MHADGTPALRQAPTSHPLDDLIHTAGREILAEGDALAAEAWASTTLAELDAVGEETGLGDATVAVILDELAGRCESLGDTGALVVSTALAAVAPDPHQRRFAQVAERLGGAVRGPRWLHAVGRSLPTMGFVVSDVFGDQDSILIGYETPSVPGAHALCALVDHNLRGQVKDLWLSDDFDEVLEGWQSTEDPHMRIDEVGVDEVLDRLRDAMAMTDRWIEDREVRADEVAEYRALIWARLRASGRSRSEVSAPEPTATQRDALLADFMASVPAADVTSTHPDADVEHVARSLIELRCEVGWQPLRWSPTVAVRILSGVVAGPGDHSERDLTAVYDTARAMVRFAGIESDLDQRWIDETIDAVDDIASHLDPSLAGPQAAKVVARLMSVLSDAGVDPSDPAALQAAFDALDLDDLDPRALSALGLGPPLGIAVTGEPLEAPTEDEAEQSAAQAPILARFEALGEFYGDGRKLTQTGNPTLADARALVELLGTGDVIDPVHGDRTFKTRSAGDLLDLSLVLAWARECGVVRVERGRMKATKQWARRHILDRWQDAVDTIDEIGPCGAWLRRGQRGPEEFVDHLIDDMFEVLSYGPCPFDDLLRGVLYLSEAVEWLVPYMQDPDMRATSLEADLGRAIHVLGLAGVVERTNTEVAADRPGGSSRSRGRISGGTVSFTPAGLWWFSQS